MYQPRTINWLLGQTKILELAASFERSEIAESLGCDFTDRAGIKTNDFRESLQRLNEAIHA